MTSLSGAQIIVGHRGASHDAPENTLASFELAWRQGADGIEGDFHLTKDRRLICVHDYDMKRVSGDPRKVVDLTFDEIRSLDVGKWKAPEFAGEHPPTLEEMLATVPAGGRAVVELKTGPEIVDPFLSELGDAGFAHDKLVVIAFNEATIAACKRRLPEVKCHWLTGIKKKQGAWTPTVGEVGESVRRASVDGVGFQGVPEVLDAGFLQEAGIREFHVWTIDDAADARYFRELGALGITTNRPAWLREQLEKTP
ncbi:glycerophosphodiester phosphodiesterase [Posidoniimonas polymericola]|nr:glycerophosphodiester phosphodiesterase [Posidoniimonas polymericola]